MNEGAVLTWAVRMDSVGAVQLEMDEDCDALTSNRSNSLFSLHCGTECRKRSYISSISDSVTEGTKDLATCLLSECF